MKKLLIGLLVALFPVLAQAQQIFPTLMTTTTAAGTWSNMPIDTQAQQPAPAALSVTFVTVGNSGNRVIAECSNDVTFANGGVSSGPAAVEVRFIGTAGTTNPGSASFALTAGRTFIFPVMARYCRLFYTTFAGTGDVAIITLMGSNPGPIWADQGQSNISTPWPVVVGSYPGAPSSTAAATVTAMANAGSTGAVTVALGAASGRTTYVCGFDVSAIGGTAAIGPITIGQIAGGFTLTYQASSSAAGIIISKTFTPCLPAVSTNTQIFGTTTADGTATAVDFNIYGYIY